MSKFPLDEGDYDPTPSPRTRARVTIAVIAIMVLLAIGLVRALTPEFAARVVSSVMSSFSVSEPPPSPPPPPEKSTSPAGDAGSAGRKAVPREASAPRAKVLITDRPVPPNPARGAAESAGAASQGNGTGAQGQGAGPGAGGSGNGTGSGAVTRPVHISGNITNAAEFPLPPGGREARIGKSVILRLTIGPDGRANACSTYRSSGFPDTDAVACRLAMRNLRFKPATNAAGQPVTGKFYWQQKFFF